MGGLHSGKAEQKCLEANPGNQISNSANSGNDDQPGDAPSESTKPVAVREAEANLCGYSSRLPDLGAFCAYCGKRHDGLEASLSFYHYFMVLPIFSMFSTEIFSRGLGKKKVQRQ
jgi:hypothetical protein